MALLHLNVANSGVCPEFDHEAGDELRAVLGEPDDTVILRSRLGDRRRRRYRLEWRNATEGQVYVVRTLFQAAGATQTMNYIPPDETAIVEVRFAESTLRITRNSVNHWEMDFEVMEVLR